MTSERLDFEDIVDLIMAEEPVPTYEAMTRWVGRYPLYAHELKEFFKTWAFVEAEAATTEPVALDEEEVVQHGVNFALDLARQQDRIAAERPLPQLHHFDQVILAAIYGLRDNAYNLSIAEKAGELLGRHAVAGKLILSLDRLEKSGLIQSRVENSDRTQGKNRRYFTVTLAGEHVVEAAKAVSDEIAGFLGDFA